MVSKNTEVDTDNQEEPRSSITSETTIVIADDDDDDDICEAEHLRKLFIGGLSVETTDEKLRRFYSEWGQVVDSVVMRDSVTKRSRGFGFITYTKSSMVDAAQANRPHIIDSKKVESKRALPRPEQPPTDGKKNISVKKLFVGGLKDNHDEECLKEHFSQFGKVVSVKILIDNTTGKRRGFAFIEYDDYDAVDKAILQKTHLIKYVLVDVRKSIYTQDEKKKFPEKDLGRNPERNQVRDQGNTADFRTRVNQNNMLQRPYQQGYQGMNRQPPMPVPQQQYHQMPAYQQGPPANYNPWGPPTHPPPQPPGPYSQPTPHPMQYQPPMPPHNYGGYQQPPIPPAQPPIQQGSWNGYAPAANNWNAPPLQAPVPSQPPQHNWQHNQWCAPPPIGGPPVPPMPPGNQPPPNWQQPPAPMPPGNQPPQNWQQPPVPQQPPPPPPPPNNFGNGYQQNYGGGPAKNAIMHPNRMNPYNAQPNQYNNHPVQGYGNANGNKFRR